MSGVHAKKLYADLGATLEAMCGLRELTKKLTGKNKIIQVERRVNPAHLAVAFPLYIYPANQDTWAPLYAAIAANPSVSFNIIINPRNGPGSPVPDSNYIESISQLHNHTNTNVFGYVHSSWGARNLSALEADISMYQAWAKYSDADIHVDGIFVDEAPSNTDFVQYMSGIYTYTKSVLSKGSTVWTNPGVAVDTAFYDVADLINAFENTYQYWMKQGGKKSIPATNHPKSTVMIHGFDSRPHKLAKATHDLTKAGYDSVLITTDANYTSFSPILADFASAVSTSGATGKTAPL